MSFRYLPALLCAASTLVTPAAAQQTTAGEPAERPLTLADALQMVVGASPDVAIADALVRRADAEQRRARAERLPQLAGSVGYTRTLATEFDVLRSDNGLPAGPPPGACAPFAPDPALPLGEQITRLARTVECVAEASPFAFGDLFGELPFGRTNQFLVGLSFAQPVFTGGRIDALARAAAAQRDAAGLGLVSSRARAVLEAAEAFFDAALSDRVLAIAESSLQQSEATLRQASVSFRTGTVAEFEVLRARVQRDNQRSQIVRRRAERDVSHLRLKQLLELPADQPLLLVTRLADEPIPAVVRLIGVPDGDADLQADADDRTAVRQAAAAVAAQESRVRATASQRLPEVTLSSSFARVAYPAGGLPGWSDFRTNWTVGVAMQVPLFTGGRLDADLRVAEAELDEARQRLRQTRDFAALDRRSAQAHLRAAEAAWEASAGTAEEAAEAVRIVEIRFREGISTQLEVADTQLQLQQAEINRAQAARDLQVARIRAELLPFLPLTAPAAPPDRLRQAPPASPMGPVQPVPGGLIRAADMVPGASRGGARR